MEGHCGERGKPNLNRGTNRDHLELPQGEELSELCAIAEEMLEELCCGDGSCRKRGPWLGSGLIPLRRTMYWTRYLP